MVLENRTVVTSGEEEGSVKIGARGASGVFVQLYVDLRVSDRTTFNLSKPSLIYSSRWMVYAVFKNW